MYLKLAAIFVIKAITFKKGTLALLSSSIAFLVTALLQNFATDHITVQGLLTYLIKDEQDVKHITLSTIIQTGFVFWFLLLTIGDLITGIQASFYVNKMSDKPQAANQVVKSYKLWRTFWKTFGVIVITSMLTFLLYFTIIADFDTLYWTAIWSLITFWLMSCGFEFYSIGENLARMNNGKKPKIFLFIDRVLNAIQNKIIKKIDDTIDYIGSQAEEQTEKAVVEKQQQIYQKQKQLEEE